MGKPWVFIAAGAAIFLLALLYAATYPTTQYAEGYSEASFKRIKAGMPLNDVFRLVDSPIYSPQSEGFDFLVVQCCVDEIGGRFDLGWYEREVVVSNKVVVATTRKFRFRPAWKR